MAYQSLYRRYRPRRFGEVVGQQHVVTALRNAVREGRTGHAYLFSGPRGTGKTSVARILARALNCTEGSEGEPCGRCESCVAMENGASYDLHELDAASNNGVDAMRDLIAKAALGSPGRTKVYILDEVHMLSTAASNALLKTLEEPPHHVTFVLATTDPQRVLPTIRSRAQHFEFGLIPADDLERHVRHVMADAGLELDDDAVAYAMRKGGGSARDTLSALDQVAALGQVVTDGEPLDGLLEALVARSTGGALTAVAAALQSGREPRVLGEQLLARLRDAFLLAVGAPADHLPEVERARAAEAGRRLGPAAVTRALEALGEALVEMRQAPDPRVPLEVALVRVTRPELDTSLAALVERVATLERQLAAGLPPSTAEGGRPAADGLDGADGTVGTPVEATPPSSTGPAPPRPAGRRPSDRFPAGEAGRPPPALSASPESPSHAPAAPGPARGPAAEARRRLQDRQTEAPPTSVASPDGGPAEGPSADRPLERPPPPARSSVPSSAAPGGQPAERAMAEPGPDPAGPSGLTEAAEGNPPGPPDAAELSQAWSAQVFERLSMPAKARFRAGRFLRVDDGAAVFGLPNAIHRDRCEEKRAEVESALAAHFGRSVPLRLVVDQARDAPVLPGGARAVGPGADAARAAAMDDDEELDLADVHALPDANDTASTVVDRLLQAFPGSQVLE